MSKLERALEESLARLTHGEATLEECLARYPEHAVELRRLVAAAGKLEQGRSISPAPVFRTRARAELVAYMRTAPRQPRPRLWARLLPQRFGLALGQTFNLAFNTAAVALLVLATVTVLAQMALPGDGLYRWKVSSERAWRAVYFDPFKTDLFLVGRRVAELTQVAGDPAAEQIARQEYQQSLATLMSGYTSPDSQEIISDALVEQKNNLQQAGVEVPELDRLLTTMTRQEVNLLLAHRLETGQPGLITSTLTLTNAGPVQAVTALLISKLSPREKLVSATGADCKVSAQGEVTCALAELNMTTPQTINLTTAIDPCYRGVITHTATTVMGAANFVNTNTAKEVLAVSTIAAPFPREAQVAYVQSDHEAHNLGLVTANNLLLTHNLHLRAAAPAWSPDGTQLAFAGESGISELGGVYGLGSGVWRVDIVKGKAENPEQLVAQAHVNNIAWSPDGTKLAFEVAPPGLPHEVRIIKAANGQEISRFPGEQPAWYPDNQKLIIKSCASDCGLWQVDLAGRIGQQITSGDTDSYPIWSPAGEYLAFSSRREASDWEIYLLRQSDGEVQRLTRRPGTDTTPVFDACGQELYLRTDVYGDWWVTVMKLDGSDERKVQKGVGPSDDWGLARPAVY
jgi:hypothetical protein